MDAFTHDQISGARVGDWLETRGIHGEPARRGEILEIMGRPGHEHFRVRWDEQHESIVYPADGVSVVRQAHKRKPRRS
ncbi:MAG TPA: DUF1918 domain-containing protein [Solirubrobacteraceae bacterium]